MWQERSFSGLRARIGSELSTLGCVAAQDVWRERPCHFKVGGVTEGTPVVGASSGWQIRLHQGQ